MPIKFNPITGTPDLIEDKKWPIDASSPENKPNGYVSLVYNGADGKVYWFVNGQRYVATGTAG